MFSGSRHLSDMAHLDAQQDVLVTYNAILPIREEAT